MSHIALSAAPIRARTSRARDWPPSTLASTLSSEALRFACSSVVAKVLTFVQIHSNAAAAARDAVADAEEQAAILNERLQLLSEERDAHVSHPLH